MSLLWSFYPIFFIFFLSSLFFLLHLRYFICFVGLSADNALLSIFWQGNLLALFKDW